MKRLFNSLLLLSAFAVTTVFTGCKDEPDKYEISGGNPTISYIRPLDIEKADSILTGAYMDNSICIVGSNLRSITKMLFNDQEAKLIPSLITDNTMIVTVPGKIPGEVFNKIFMINNSNDTTTYDFKVLIPGPSINNMTNGVYLDYILSFPVNYSKDVREHLLASFDRGLRKSLPPAILNDAEAMRLFRVYAGASEPAAYAICALKELQLEPKEPGQKVSYAVFDSCFHFLDRYRVIRSLTEPVPSQINELHNDPERPDGLRGSC